MRRKPNAAQMILFPDFTGQETSMVAAFKRFHRDNPHIYRRLLRLALDLKKKGRSSHGMKGLFEVLRWQHAIQTAGSKYKLNNNYTAFYSRMIMVNEKSLIGFFRIRRSEGARVNYRELG